MVAKELQCASGIPKIGFYIDLSQQILIQAISALFSDIAGMEFNFRAQDLWLEPH